MRHFNRRLAAALCLALLALAALGWAGAEQTATAGEITKQCAFRVSEGEKGKLTDQSTRTAWSYDREGAYVAVKLPEGVPAGWLRVEWQFDPTGFELIEYDANRAELRRRDQSCTFPNIYTVLDLLPETAYVQLAMTAKGQEICAVRVYSQGALPGDVQVWNPPVEKADLMVVSTHQDDELIFLGGTIPYYATALKKPTVVVYMANCGRYRRNEALNALWKMGVRDYPEFINLKDKKVDKLSQAVELWGGKDNVLDVLVQRIRRFKPEVIVTQDLDGEYGHNQHKLTARAMMYAVEAAADPARYPESFQKYGAWQVKKLYHHLYKENQIQMDWETPLDALNGYTPLKVAQIGMDEHASQLKYFSVKSHGKYDNALFGLYYTAVGPDVAKNDFLENIDPDASAKYLAEHAQDALPAQTGLIEEAGLVEDAGPAEDAGLTAQAPGEGEAQAVAGALPEAESDEDEVFAEPVDAPVAEVDAELSEAMADMTPAPTAVPEAAPRPAAESGGAGPAIALVALGAAALGAGGWYGYRTFGRRRRRRRRRRR